MKKRFVFMGLLSIASAHAQDEGDEAYREEAVEGEGEGEGERPNRPERREEEVPEKPAPVVAETKYKVTDATTELSGATLADVAQAVRALAEVGSMVCAPSLDFDENGNDPPRVRGCRLTVECIRTLPVWTQAKSNPAADQKVWERFLASVSQHQDAHLAKQKPFFDDVCPATIGRTLEEGEAVVDKYRARAEAATVDLDTETQHGRKTGVVLNAGGGKEEGAAAPRAPQEAPLSALPRDEEPLDEGDQ